MTGTATSLQEELNTKNEQYTDLEREMAMKYGAQELIDLKPDSYFQDGFKYLQDEIEQWVFRNFRGASYVPYLLEVLPERRNSLSTAITPKDANTILRRTIMRVIQKYILQAFLFSFER